jgi:acylphosphatase
MSATQAIRCWVAGRVQGVYYRAATAATAQRLGIDGVVRNLEDGRVEVIACAPAGSLAEFVGWLWRGPPAARVDAIAVEEWREHVAQGFLVAR